MSEVETGQKHVIDELLSACDRTGLVLDRYEWGAPHFDVAPGSGIGEPGPTLYALVVEIGKRREVVKFTEEELTDLPFKSHLGTKARVAVTEKVTEVLAKFEPRKPRIGF